MSFLVDTDIASAYIRSNGLVLNRFVQYGGRLSISTITLTELLIWLGRKKTRRAYVQALPGLLLQVQLFPVDQQVAQLAGQVGADLLDRGLTIAKPDLLIAATALANSLTLVTHNARDYVNIAGLGLADWLVP